MTNFDKHCNQFFDECVANQNAIIYFGYDMQYKGEDSKFISAAYGKQDLLSAAIANEMLEDETVALVVKNAVKLYNAALKRQ